MQAFTIVSRLTGPLPPASDDSVDAESAPSRTEDALTELELDAAWRNEHAFGRNGHHAPIDFVPARLKFDDFGQLLNPDAALTPLSSRTDGDSIASWYSSLPRSSSITPVQAATPASVESTTVLRPARVSKNEWFVQKVLAAESPHVLSKAATLSDMLEREPPGEFKAPVWTSIGPGNRGFALLQRSGWQEGQALGPGAAGPSKSPAPMKTTIEVIDLTDDGPIDLTVIGDDRSDTEEEEEEEEDDNTVETNVDQEVEPKTEPTTESPSSIPCLPAGDSDSTALLVPLPAFLKPDKHGIGVRHESERRRLRLKSTAQAIAEATPEGTKKHKRILEAARKRREAVGRGARGFARLSKAESNQRQAMMTYMHS